MNVGKKKIIFITGIIISIFCSWLFARKIEWSHLNVAFRDANYVYIIPAIIIFFTGHCLRAFRWSLLFAPIKKVSVLNLFSANMIGFMANNVLPARVGEILRPVMIARKENIKMTTTFATVVMERIFDLLSIIFIASILFFFLPTEISKDKRVSMINHTEASTENFNRKLSLYHNGTGEKLHLTAVNEEKQTDAPGIINRLKRLSMIMAFSGVLVMASLFLLSLYPKKASIVIEKLIFFLPHYLKNKIVNLLHSFVTGLQIFDNKKKLIWIGFNSLVIWLLNASCVYVLCYSFNIELSFAGACFVIVCLALAVALPQAPGYIGVFHFTAQKALAIFGVGLPTAQSYAVMLWAISVIPVSLAGLIFLWREGISFGELSKYKEKMELSVLP